MSHVLKFKNMPQLQKHASVVGIRPTRALGMTNAYNLTRGSCDGLHLVFLRPGGGKGLDTPTMLPGLMSPQSLTSGPSTGNLWFYGPLDSSDLSLLHTRHPYHPGLSKRVLCTFLKESLECGCPSRSLTLYGEQQGLLRHPPGTFKGARDPCLLFPQQVSAAVW